ncbi:hypothetical protein KKB40_02305 [Patescibacteria group bacterium]|nr:hypothetical protein [Patescibacteria group bacterium]
MCKREIKIGGGTIPDGAHVEKNLLEQVFVEEDVARIQVAKLDQLRWTSQMFLLEKHRFCVETQLGLALVRVCFLEPDVQSLHEQSGILEPDTGKNYFSYT